ncbi:double-stranded DNA-binding domain-containing protein [Xylariaceae sp. FL0016]|nr:double-stranded DNA-binding domain-containing protein [Xylariaceae sp. FL0016]
MADPELEKIRQARLEQLKAQSGSGAGAQSEQSQAEQQKQQETKALLDQILTPEAADRLGLLRVAGKSDLASGVEGRLIMMARSNAQQTGRLPPKITDAQLKGLLSAVAETKEEEKIVVNRRKGWDDEDDDLLDL